MNPVVENDIRIIPDFVHIKQMVVLTRYNLINEICS